MGCNYSYFYLTEYLRYSVFSGLFGNVDSCGICYQLPSKWKKKPVLPNSYSLIFQSELAPPSHSWQIQQCMCLLQQIGILFYVYSMSFGILTLSFLLKTHAPNGLKALTSKDDIFHWPVAKPEDFCFQNKNIIFASQKKSLNLSVDKNTSERLQV